MEKRVLRLKVTMSFGMDQILVAGEYEGDSIPECLEREFKSGSPHVEEIITKVSVKAADKKPLEDNPARDAKKPTAKSKKQSDDDGVDEDKEAAAIKELEAMTKKEADVDVDFSGKK